MKLAQERLSTPTADQEKLKVILDGWRDDGDIVYYRPSSYGVSNDAGNVRFLLVFQTRNQRNLLSRYGNEICLFDATYKTTRYSLPLFLVVVKTNMDYQVVGQFMTESEESEAIEEGITESLYFT